MSRPLCLWSGPRNISTAMMRSFSSRTDTTCWDEPFFAAFLNQTGLDHPGRAETLAACETDPDRIVDRILAPVRTAFHFQKHMAHHMIAGMPMDWISKARHVLLVRHPARVIASYAKGRPTFTENDLGFRPLLALHKELEARTGQRPMVVDSDEILAAPEAELHRICVQGFSIPFDRAMLAWDAGSRPEDGPWAPYWYRNVTASTGFADPPSRIPALDPQYAEIYSRSLEDYKALVSLRSF